MHRLGSSSRCLKTSSSYILDSHARSHSRSMLHATRFTSHAASAAEPCASSPRMAAELNNTSKPPKLGHKHEEDGMSRQPSKKSKKQKAMDAILMKELATALGVEKNNTARAKGPRTDAKQNASRDGMRGTQFQDSKPAVEFSAEADDYEIGCTVKPGTFVETRRNEIVSYGIVLGETVVGLLPMKQVLLSNGDVFYGSQNDFSFAIPSVASAALVARCGIDNLVLTDVNLKARVEVLRRIREIVVQVEERFRHVSKKCAGMYDAFRSEDPRQWTSVTLMEAARLIDPKPDLLTIFTTHQALTQQSKYFVLHRDYLVRQEFHVRPLAEVEHLQKVTQWIRLPTGKGPIDNFALKARTIMEISKQASQDSGTPAQSPALHTWSDTDKDIIQFLLCSVRPSRSNQNNPYDLGMSSIIRRVLPSLQEVSADVVYRLLVDIGVLAPWQDSSFLHPDLNLDPDPQKSDAIVQRGFATPASRKVLGPEDFYPTDPLETIRHDFGDLPVYVIDDMKAQELDDGISIERVPSESGTFWIHVHIADPGSLLHPGHKLAKDAEKKGTTLYFAHRTYPLFPKAMMYAENHGLSLGTNTARGLPERVMTFSTKVDERGQILDYRVRAGLVHNVQILSYDQVDSHLSGKIMQRSYPFEPHKRLDSMYSTLNQRQADDLKLMQQLFKSHMDQKIKDGYFFVAASLSQASDVKIPDDITSPTLEPSVFTGYPQMTYEVDDVSLRSSFFGSRDIIAECAKLACRAGSRYGVEHNLPLLRRGSTAFGFANDHDRSKAMSLRDENGGIPYENVAHLLSSLPTTAYSVEPKAHATLLIPEGEGYSRVTSPLRRYPDLMMHWQIQHSLLGSRAPSSKLPYTREYLEDFGMRWKLQESRLQYISRYNNNFYCYSYIERWMRETARLREQGKEREHDPLRSLVAVVRAHSEKNSRDDSVFHAVTIPSLGLRAILMLKPGSPNIPIGSRVDVEISKVLTFPTPDVYVSLK